jgi:hypothetical protein
MDRTGVAKTLQGSVGRAKVVFSNTRAYPIHPASDGRLARCAVDSF